MMLKLNTPYYLAVGLILVTVVILTEQFSQEKESDPSVSANDLYGGTYTMFNNILPDFGIQTRFVDALVPANIEAAITDRTRMLFVETIGNPKLDVVNMREIAKIANKHHLPLVVDSTQRPGCRSGQRDPAGPDLARLPAPRPRLDRRGEPRRGHLPGGAGQQGRR